jgi:hypothetical protein
MQKERTWRRRSTTDRNRESMSQSLAMPWKSRRGPGEGRGGFRCPWRDWHCVKFAHWTVAAEHGPPEYLYSQKRP